MAPTIRPPAVAGRFYPRDPDQLRADLRSYFPPGQEALHTLGCVVPHAGYVYSGHIAGAVYARVVPPARCLLMCPNHTARIRGTEVRILPCPPVLSVVS